MSFRPRVREVEGKVKGGGGKEMRARGKQTQPRLVPWSCWEEWRQVKRNLVDSKDGARNAMALDLVACWRVRGRVPLAVDATAELVQISLQGNTISMLSPYIQRLTVSMALVRLVNGISGALQKGVYAKSVAGLAESVGLPRILVDVRHEATHNVLPSLSILNIAAGQALDWLQDNYWNPQEEQLKSQDTQMRDTLASLLQLCLKSSSSSSGVTETSNEEDSSTKRRRAELLKDLIELVHPSQTSVLAASLCHAIFQNPGGFTTENCKGWKTFLSKLCKYWPTLGVSILQSCWEALLRAEGEGKREWERGPSMSRQGDPSFFGGADRIGSILCVFLPWLLEHRHLWGTVEQTFLRVLHNTVLDGARLLKTQKKGKTQKDYLSTLLGSCFDTLSSRENATPEMKACLKILDQVIHPESTTSGPDIWLKPLPLSDGKAEWKRGSEGQVGKEGVVEGNAAGVERRWKRCKRWTPCAVGNLPSLGNANGTMPLELLPEDAFPVVGSGWREGDPPPQANGGKGDEPTQASPPRAFQQVQQQMEEEEEVNQTHKSHPTILEALPGQAPKLNVKKVQESMKLLF